MAYCSDETFWDCILEADSEAAFEAVVGAFYDDGDAMQPVFMIMNEGKGCFLLCPDDR